MREKNNLDQIIDEQEIHFIELPEFLKTKFDTDKKLDQWLLLILLYNFQNSIFY